MIPAKSSPKILLIVHQRYSDPGRVGLRLRTHGMDLEIRRPACGDSLPDSMDDYAGAVVFGGPMSANDDHEAFIRDELAWIPRAVESGKPFLGICLGAQLLARTLGATVTPHADEMAEIGYFPICPTAAGRDLFEPGFHVFQWHVEGFGVPDSAELLATGDIFRNQAFRYGRNAYGLQFHPEVTEAMNRRWTIKGAARLSNRGAQSAEEQLAGRARHDNRMSRWLDRFIVHWLDQEQAPVKVASAEQPALVAGD
ncbi:glutamine amidotransferase-related protein [Oceanibacterium hippocampi]|uniref:Glutamine amidotransferase n=1 Tax=Oceanibacterium hippocampi TaxID=745714 RepID=A0A1Y5R9Y4_9PROT|nr:gamma-glutamyl-gamma-aminobutyrate hydrolase family protein [Oceanibacterium hippocampi]SLN12463.1 glutamine amidotransferase [Oceanibacterium hippocampi]